jgi:uncharacterized protein
MPSDASDFAATIASTLGVSPKGVQKALALLADKATIPFIARYRKELTGGLDEVVLRQVEAQHRSLSELAQRKQAIVLALEKQGQLSAELREQIARCSTRTELEDLYLPFKPRRRTRAQAARERGLGPLAERILTQALQGSLEREARPFVNPAIEVPDVASAIQGAKDIVAELVSERGDVRALCRESYAKHGWVRSAAIKKVAAKGPTKFEQYYDYSERISKIPSHRYLAIRRGEQEGVLRVKIDVEQAEALIDRLLRLVKYAPRSPFGRALYEAVHDGFERLLSSSIENECATELKARSEAQAVEVFAENLEHLLLAAPLGGKAVLGIDPGFRTGCKCAVIDGTGKLLEFATIYPSGGAAQISLAKQKLAELLQRHAPSAIAIGNGTGGRETAAFVRQELKAMPQPHAMVVSVNEAGASVYSASELARREFPDLDLTLRGAISIARRLQDPLAELVKIDPQAIGVGQYQHDLPEAALRRRLGEVVESCVNRVGVELNTASAELLAHVAGVGPAIAQAIVLCREAKGPYRTRKALLQVPKLGDKTFEQAAGFLRIQGGPEPLDASAVHPERYEVVERMAREHGFRVSDLVGNSNAVEHLRLASYVDEATGLGLPTLEDIASELKKPGRDPRATFEPPKFRDDVAKLEDLRVGMQLEGVVTNVTAFGAFVDVGVHQDGLVHVSELATQFVKNPADVVSVGDLLEVRVLAVDLTRKRISLSAKPAKTQADKRAPGD